MVKIISDPRYKINKKKIKNYASSYLSQFGFSEDYVLNLIFVGSRKMRETSANYKKEKRALPVLSFSYLVRKGRSWEVDTAGSEEKLIGEIFLCYPQIVLLASERQRKVNDMINMLVKHGIDTICSI